MIKRWSSLSGLSNINPIILNSVLSENFSSKYHKVILCCDNLYKKGSEINIQFPLSKIISINKSN